MKVPNRPFSLIFDNGHSRFSTTTQANQRVNMPNHYQFVPPPCFAAIVPPGVGHNKNNA
jgi:hypothetical protein